MTMTDPTEPRSNRKTGSIPRVEVEPEPPREPPELPEFRNLGAITGRITINLQTTEGEDEAKEKHDRSKDAPTD